MRPVDVAFTGRFYCLFVRVAFAPLPVLLPKMGNSVSKTITRQWRKGLLMTGGIPVSADRWKFVLHVKGLGGIWNENLLGFSLEL